MSHKIEQYREVIEPKLDAYMSQRTEEAGRYYPFMGTIYEQASEFLLRKGKRIASFTTLLTYEGYRGKEKGILDICISMELYRHAILIHDDLVDMDDFRRGGKSFHRLFTDNLLDQRFGEGLAVFFGNIFFSHALAVLLGAKFRRDLIWEASKTLVEGYRSVNESQILDQLFEYKEPTIAEWRVMASKRAASLFKTTILTGAILAEAPGKDFPILKDAVKNIGYTFDIQDDIIGSFASEEQYGRPIGGDILLGKKPLHLMYAYQLASQRELEELKVIFQSRERRKEQIGRVKEIIYSSGALAKAKAVSKEHAEKAIFLLEKTSMNKDTKGFFKDLIQYVVESIDWYK